MCMCTDSLCPLQALARMGATVTGIEPQHDNISAAMAHAQGDPVVAERTTYLAITAEKLSDSGATFKPAGIWLLLAWLYVVCKGSTIPFNISEWYCLWQIQVLCSSMLAFGCC